jgi:hypothetical protein
MKIIKLLSVMSFMWCLFAGAAQAQSVQSDFDRNFELPKFKSFNFAVQKRSPDDPLAADALNDERIKNALLLELTASGFQMETAAEPDFTVAYFVTTKNKYDLREYGYGLPRWFSARDIRVDQYTEGTLTVDVIDAKTSRLVWRGRALGTIEMKNMDEKISKAVEKLVSRFVKDTRKKA